MMLFQLLIINIKSGKGRHKSCSPAVYFISLFFILFILVPEFKSTNTQPTFLTMQIIPPPPHCCRTEYT